MAFPRRHWLSLPLRRPRGACLFGRLSPLPLAYLSAPYPPNPLPQRGRGRPKLFFARGFAPCIPSIRPPAALVRPAAVENSMAAFPRRHWLSLPLWCPRGACLFGCLSPLPLALFLPPIPPTPFPAGEGGDQSYFMQGAPPLASPRLSPGGTYRTSQAGARRGAVSCRACFARRINAFLPPIPPTPFPGGEGGDQSYFMQGAPPLASPALDRLRHLLDLPRGRGPSQTPPSRQRRIVPSPPVPPLLGCRHCSPVPRPNRHATRGHR